MRIFKRTVAFLCALFIIESFFSFLLEPVTFEHFLNFDIREIKKEKKTIELAFFGDSQAIRTYDPVIFEEDMGEYVDIVLNEGVNQQHFVSTYYYMKDLLKRNQIKYAVVNINYEHFLNNVDEPVEAKGITFDRIKSLTGMADYIYNRFPIEEYPNVLKSYRYRWQAKNIPDTLRKKLTTSYITGKDVRTDIHYVDKGYATWNLAYKQGNTGTPANCTPWREEFEDKDTLIYMDKMAELCDEYGVKLIFTVSPITIGRMYAIDNYSEFNVMLQEECNALGVPFFNMNLLKENNISFDDTNFTDTEHVNDIGSAKASHFLATVITRELEQEDAIDGFYASFDEMVERHPQIGACDVFVSEEKSTDSDIFFEAISFHDTSIIPLYQFSISCDDGKTYTVIQDYGEKSTCTISKEKYKKWILRVDTIPKDKKDLHHCYMEISGES